MIKKPLNIFISEWIPSLNKGELAILHGMIKSFKFLGPKQIYILSFYPEIDKIRYPEEIRIINAEKDLFLGKRFPERSLIIRSILSLFVLFQHLLFAILYLFFHENSLRIMRGQIWKEYIDSDIIIFGHDQIDCSMGFYLLFHPISIILIRRIINKKVAIYGNGSSSTRISRILLSFILSNVDLVTTRDRPTYQLYKKISLSGIPLFLTADPAILLQPTKNERVKNIMKGEKIFKNDDPLIGMALSYDVLDYPSYDRKDQKISCIQRIKMMSQLINYLINNFNANIIFFPHSIEPYRNLDDRFIAKIIYNLVDNKQKIYIIKHEYSPQELKGLIGQLDIFIGTRVHALINAASMCVPFICLVTAQDKRAQGILGDMFGQKEWIFNVDNLELDKLCQKAACLLSIKNKVSKDLELKNSIIEKMAMLNGKLLKLLVMKPQK